MHNIIKLRRYKDALFSLISLTLKILGIYIKSSQESSEMYNDKTQMFVKLKRIVNAWISEAIGGTVFGGEVKDVWFKQFRYHGTELVKSSEELQVIIILMYIPVSSL